MMPTAVSTPTVAAAPRLTKAFDYGLPGHTGPVAYDAVQRLAAVGLSTGTVYVVGQPGCDAYITLYEGEACAVTHVAFHQGAGELMAVTADRAIHVIDLSANQVSRRLSLPDTITAVATVPLKPWLFAGTKHGVVYLFDTESGNRSRIVLRLLETHPSPTPPNLLEANYLPCPIVALLCHPIEPNLVLIAFQVGYLYVYDLATNQVVFQVALPANDHLCVSKDGAQQSWTFLTSVAWRPDGVLFAAAYEDGYFAVWDFLNRKKVPIVRRAVVESVPAAMPLSPIVALRWVTMRPPTSGPSRASQGSLQKTSLSSVAGSSQQLASKSSSLNLTEVDGTPLQEGTSTLIALGGRPAGSPQGFTFLTLTKAKGFAKPSSQAFKAMESIPASFEPIPRHYPWANGAVDVVALLHGEPPLPSAMSSSLRLLHHAFVSSEEKRPQQHLYCHDVQHVGGRAMPLGANRWQIGAGAAAGFQALQWSTNLEPSVFGDYYTFRPSQEGVQKGELPPLPEEAMNGYQEGILQGGLQGRSFPQSCDLIVTANDVGRIDWWANEPSGNVGLKHLPALQLSLPVDKDQSFVETRGLSFDPSHRLCAVGWNDEETGTLQLYRFSFLARQGEEREDALVTFSEYTFEQQEHRAARPGWQPIHRLCLKRGLQISTFQVTPALSLLSLCDTIGYLRFYALSTGEALGETDLSAGSLFLSFRH